MFPMKTSIFHIFEASSAHQKCLEGGHGAPKKPPTTSLMNLQVQVDRIWNKVDFFTPKFDPLTPFLITPFEN